MFCPSSSQKDHEAPKFGNPQVFLGKVGPEALRFPRYYGNPAGAASQRSGWDGVVPEWRGAVVQERLQAGGTV